MTGHGFTSQISLILLFTKSEIRNFKSNIPMIPNFVNYGIHHIKKKFRYAFIF